MNTDNKTLADVQPGGRVRLGDEAERSRFEAWVKSHVSSLARSADGDYASNFTHALWSAWQAALADRQPVEFERAIPTRRRESAVELLMQLGFVWNNQRWEDRRQPVGEPVGYFDPDVLAHLTEGLIDPVGVLRRKPNGTSNVPVWLGPPAQAVDLGQFRPFVEAQRAEYISHGLTEEDYCVAECDELMALIDSKAVGK